MSLEQKSFFADNNKNYKVLARKYRPQKFAELVGQEIMVQTFTNAMQLGRLAHAYLLTGIRGVGKTTTARIFAKSFNCVAAGREKDHTAEPCNQCVHCQMIAEDKHPDVREIDAASNTGVNDIRDIIQDTKYRPTSARYKIYIIDEVHMLSISAFNALLKTLEEPPAHVKFIFATTEFKKIPITIVSRCQRLDLRRIERETLSNYFTNVVQAEGFSAEKEALNIIANCAAGSVRDGLSLLDQALSLQGGQVTAEGVRSMLGLADTSRIYQMYAAIVSGKIKEALALVQTIYNDGGDPSIITQELLNITYIVTKIKVTALEDVISVPQDCQQRLRELAQQLDIIFLARSWQMLSKGLEEVQKSLSPLASLEMLLIRITHANLDETPESLLRQLSGNGSSNQPVTNIQHSQLEQKLTSFADVVNKCLEHEEAMLYHNLKNYVVPCHFEQGIIHLHFLPQAPQNTLKQLKEFLFKISTIEWQIIINDTLPESAISIAATEQQNLMIKKDKIIASPLVQDILNHFTGLEIADIKVKH